VKKRASNVITYQLVISKIKYIFKDFNVDILEEILERPQTN